MGVHRGLLISKLSFCQLLEAMKTVALRNGVHIPVLGCGTAVFSDIGPEQKNKSADFAAMIVENAVLSGAR